VPRALLSSVTDKVPSNLLNTSISRFVSIRRPYQFPLGCALSEARIPAPVGRNSAELGPSDKSSVVTRGIEGPRAKGGYPDELLQDQYKSALVLQFLDMPFRNLRRSLISGAPELVRLPSWRGSLSSGATELAGLPNWWRSLIRGLPD
jgi:hypothetical protein